MTMYELLGNSVCGHRKKANGFVDELVTYLTFSPLVIRPHGLLHYVFHSYSGLVPT